MYGHGARFGTPPQHEVYRHAKAGDIEKVKYWLDNQSFPIDQKDFYSNTLLYYGCLCNHPPLVAYLMERGATFLSKTSDGKRTFLASANQDIRHLLLGIAIQQRPKVVETWYTDAMNSPSFSDIKFTVDGKSFNAHKVILAARCPYLIPKLEKQDTIAMGNAITEPLFDNFLTYVYTEQVKLEDHHHKPLVQMSKKLGLQGLFNTLSGVKEVDPACSMAENLKSMVNNPLFSDIMLTTDDGAKIYAHKIILTTKSDYFKTLFSEQWGHEGATCNIPDMSIDVLTAIVQYMYTGSVEVNENNILDVMAASDLFLLPKLKSELELDVIANYLDAESCLELVNAGDILCCVKLYKASVRILANNISALRETPEFIALKLSIRQEVLALTNVRVKN